MANIQQILKDARTHMDKAIDSVKHEFASVRSSKATTNMLDTVRVEVYGTQMMLNQVASLAAPEPRLLTVTPFDKSQIKVIEKAIREAELGLAQADPANIPDVLASSLLRRARSNPSGSA